MSNAGRAQDYLMQIVSADYGFDVPEIQNALTKTNYKSVEAAVEYLFKNAKQAGGSAADSKPSKTSNNTNNNNTNNNNTNNNNNSTDNNNKNNADIQELKNRIARMEIEGNLKMNVNADILNTAIKENKNTDDALNYIMDRYSHLITPNENTTIKTKQDAQQHKEKLIEQAMKKKEQQEREAREREKKIEMDQQKALKEEKEKEESRRRHKERVAMNRKRILDKKKNQKRVAQKSTLEWHKRHDRYDKDDIRRLEEIERNRQKQMESIDSPDKALQTLFERYGEYDARETIKMIIKIINNILKHPDDEKYRKLNLQNQKIKDLIVTPLGAIKFFDFLGFEEVIERDKIFPNDVLKNKKFLFYKNPNKNDCNQALLMLNKYNQINKTLVYDYIDKIRNDDKININDDDLYMGLMEIYTIINNVLISPNSQHLRMIEINNDLFKKRVGRFQIFQKFLKNIGYGLEDRVKGKVLILKINDSNLSEKQEKISFLKNVTRDLYKIAHDDVLMKTRIGNGIKAIYDHNKTNLNDLYKYFNTLIKAIDRILNEPLNMKYQSINVEKLKIKFKNTTGIISVLKLLGFKKNKDDKTKFILSSEYNGDLDLLKWRKTIFINVINDKKLLNKKQTK